MALELTSKSSYVDTLERGGKFIFVGFKDAECTIASGEQMAFNEAGCTRITYTVQYVTTQVYARMRCDPASGVVQPPPFGKS